MATKEKEQTYLEGTEPVEIKEIEEQAEKVRSLCDRRKNIQEKEKEERAALVELMHQHNQSEYRYRGFVVFLNPGEEKVSVRKVKNNGEDD